LYRDCEQGSAQLRPIHILGDFIERGRARGGYQVIIEKPAPSISDVYSAQAPEGIEASNSVPPACMVFRQDRIAVSFLSIFAFFSLDLF